MEGERKAEATKGLGGGEVDADNEARFRNWS